MTTIQSGVTAAVKAEDVDGMTREEATSLFRHVAGGLVPLLEKHVGGAKPLADPAVNIQGPENDTFQGWIYAVSLAAPFDTDDLPSDCTAYAAYLSERTPKP